MPISVNGANGITFADGSIQNTGAAGFGFKNRIINGDMRINQRAASVTASGYTVDRFQYVASASSKGTLAQSTTVYPTGFNYSLGFTSSSAYSIAAGDYFAINQTIEGYNIADLGWGTVNAKTITISFWVRSSVVGQYTGNLRNSDDTRICPFNFTINALGLTKRINDADSDDSTEAMNLRDLWDAAVESFLQEVNLSETNEIVSLTLVATDPNDNWAYAYAYPSGAALVRRILSGLRIDNNESRVEYEKGIYDGQAVLFTDKVDAEAEVAKEDNLFIGLSANGALALAYKLAYLAQGLILTSQDPVKLEQSLLAKYERFKSLAQVKAGLESHIYEDDMRVSTHSYVRMG